MRWLPAWLDRRLLDHSSTVHAAGRFACLKYGNGWRHRPGDDDDDDWRQTTWNVNANRPKSLSRFRWDIWTYIRELQRLYWMQAARNQLGIVNEISSIVVLQGSPTYPLLPQLRSSIFVETSLAAATLVVAASALRRRRRIRSLTNNIEINPLSGDCLTSHAIPLPSNVDVYCAHLALVSALPISG